MCPLPIVDDVGAIGYVCIRVGGRLICREAGQILITGTAGVVVGHTILQVQQGANAWIRELIRRQGHDPNDKDKVRRVHDKMRKEKIGRRNLPDDEIIPIIEEVFGPPCK